MNSLLYPFLLTPLSLQQSTLCYVLITNSLEFSYSAQSSQDSPIFYYTTPPNYISNPYFLYQNGFSTNQANSETNFSLNPQQVVSANSFTHFLTNSFQPEISQKIYQEQALGIIKKQEENSLIQNLCLKNSVEKRKRKWRNKPKDPVYIPHRSGTKDNVKKRHQNQNRNVIPNQISQILSYLHKRGKSQYILKKVWAKYSPPCQNYSINRFYLLQNHFKGKVGHYCNEASLKFLNDLIEPECKIWPENQQRYYIMLSRMLIGHFLRQDSIFSILTSKRMRSQKKHEHLRTRRLVTQIVKKVLKN